MTDESADVYLNRARLLVDLERWSEAAEELGYARALAPQHVDVLVLSALVALQDGRSGDAVTHAMAATAIAPGHDEAMITRALVLAEVDDRAAAAEYAAELLQADTAESALVAAALYSVVGGGQAALDAAWHAVRLAPNDPDAHWLLWRIASRMDLADVARGADVEAQRLVPDPRHRMGVWKLWWTRHGGLTALGSPSNFQVGWLPILKIAALVVAIGLVLAWLAAG